MNARRAGRSVASVAVAACVSLSAVSGARAEAGDLILVANTGIGDYGEVTNPRHRPAISADGRFVAYVAQSYGDGDPLFLRDMRGADTMQIVPPGEAHDGFDNSSPVLSADGRYLAFASEDPRLSSEDSDFTHPGGRGYPIRDIFVYDRITGGMTVASRRSGPHGLAANDDSSLPSISADGRYVAYGTESSNLTPGPLIVGGVYRRDLWTEANRLISGAPGGEFWRPGSFSPDISGDGRRVAFGFQYSRTPYDPQNPPRNISKWLHARHNQIMLADPDWKHPRLVSSASGPRGAIANANCREASASGSGRFVAFTSGATNLVPGDDNRVEDVFVRDVQRNVTTLVSRIGRRGAPGDGDSGRPAISADGRYVAFQSRADNLAAGDTDGDPDVYMKDLRSGRLILVSRGLGGEPSNGSSGVPAISASGRYVAFTSTASNLSPTNNNSRDMSFYRFQALP